MTPSPLAFGGRHPNPRNKRAAAVIGVGHTDWVRDWQRCRAVTSPAHRSTSACVSWCCRPTAISVSAAAIRGSPFRQGPH